MKKDRAAIPVVLPTMFLISWMALSALAQGNELSVESATGNEDNADLAQDLTNPVADLVSVPIQTNFDFNFGPTDDGLRVQTNIQPVIPFSLNEDWNLITRTITPVIHQEDLFPGAGSQSGLGDINQTFFLSPKQPTASGVTWGAGPVFLFPTATDPLLGGEKWAAGPSVVILRLQGAWTYGLLANHLWSFAGDDGRSDLSNTFLQPFVAYTTPDAWTFSLQSESSYNWTAEQWSIPINAAITKLVMFGKLPVSLQTGVGYWAEAPEFGPEGFRYRFQASVVLPK